MLPAVSIPTIVPATQATLNSCSHSLLLLSGGLRLAGHHLDATVKFMGVYVPADVYRLAGTRN
jgi:hypothetical protein